MKHQPPAPPPPAATKRCWRGRRKKQKEKKHHLTVNRCCWMLIAQQVVAPAIPRPAACCSWWWRWCWLLYLALEMKHIWLDSHGDDRWQYKISDAPAMCKFSNWIRLVLEDPFAKSIIQFVWGLQSLQLVEGWTQTFSFKNKEPGKRFQEPRL